MFKVLDILSGETGILVRDKGWRFERSGIEADFILAPAFFNGHTHIGDSFIEAPILPLEKLVGPGGYKFKRLNMASEEEIIQGMKKSIKIIRKTSSTSLEFREDGLRGYELCMRADSDKILTALSRPSSINEAEKLVKISYGFNFSSVRDHDFTFLEECREIARKRKKIFAIHAGEIDNRDVEKALSLEPDFLIHMNMAERKQIEEAIDMGIYIVSCFRSNAFFGLFNRRSYEIFSEYEKWLIGTDNAMIASPSMVDELKFGSYFIDPEKIFTAGTRNPFFESFMLIRADIIVEKDKSVLSMVRRLESCDIVKVIRDEILFE